LSGILTGLTESGAATDPASADPRLLGRTYAIPFDEVWTAATHLVGGGLRGWTMAWADDLAGVIVGSRRVLLLGVRDDVRVKIRLDDNAQTRVDMSAASRSDRPDLCRNRRAIGRFLRKLDEALAARPDQILDPTRQPAWTEL
jgi:hypothetical protein